MTRVPARIVSFLPSATEMLYALGLGDSLVGVTHECDWPQAASTKPVVVRASLPVVAIGEMLLWIAASLTLVTGYDYLQAGLRHMARSPLPHPINPRKSQRLA